MDGHANVLLEPDYHFTPGTCVIHWLPEGREKVSHSRAVKYSGV